jgi:hypothetical protein
MAEQISKLVKENPETEVKNQLYKRYIYFGFYNERMILAPRSKTSEFDVNDPICRASNGLVIDKKGNILSLPPPASSTVPLPYEIDFKECEIYEIQNGTTATLYFDSGWKMSSIRGIDISGVAWKKKTFKQAFDEILEENKFNSKTFYDQLDQTCCYTFGFKHPELHPFKPKNIRNLWLIEVNSRINYTRSDIEYQKFQHLALQPVVLTRGEIFHANEDSYRHFTETGIACYGFNIKYRGIWYRWSSRLNDILENLYYDNQYVKTGKTYEVSRHKAMLITNYVNDNKDIFIEMFPDFKVYFDDFDKQVYDFGEQIRNALLNRTPMPPNITQIHKAIGDIINLNPSDTHFHKKVYIGLVRKINLNILLTYMKVFDD